VSGKDQIRNARGGTAACSQEHHFEILRAPSTEFYIQGQGLKHFNISNTFAGKTLRDTQIYIQNEEEKRTALVKQKSLE
jgi:hypothetical protein